MSSLAAGLAEQLKCSVCLEEYKDPRLLRCYHSYCKRCVKALLKRSKRENAIRCPQCRTEMEIPQGNVNALKSNFVINNLLDLMADNRAEAPAATPCERCGLNNTDARVCVQCETILCPNCIEFHSEDLPTQPHTIRSLGDNEPDDDVPAETAEKDSRACAEHDLPLQLYCHSCEVFLCRKCMPASHWDHNYVVVREAVKPIRSAIDWLLVKCKVKVPAITEAVHRVEVTKDLVEVGAQEMLSHIEENIDRKISALHEKRAYLLETIDQTRHWKLKQLRAQAEELLMAQASLVSGVEFTEHALDEANANELLSMRTQLLSRLEELSGVEVHSEPCEWWNIALEEPLNSDDILDDLLRLEDVENNTDPEKSKVRMVGGEEGVIYRTFVNQSYDFIISLKDKEGARMRYGGQHVRVTIRTPDSSSRNGTQPDEKLSTHESRGSQWSLLREWPRQNSGGSFSLEGAVGLDVELEVKDNRNGTHGFTFTPNSEGNHMIQVLVNGRPLSGNLVWEVEGPLGFGDPITMGLDFIPLQSSECLPCDWHNIGGQHAWQITRIPPEEEDPNKRHPDESPPKSVPIEVGIKSDSSKERWGWRDGWRVSGNSTGSPRKGEAVRSAIEKWSEGDTFVFYHDIDAGRFTIYSKSTKAREVFRRCPGTSARPYIDPPSYDYFAMDRELEKLIFSRPNKKWS